MGQTPKKELSVEEAREIYIAAIDHMTAVTHEDVATIVAAHKAATIAGLDLAWAMAVEATRKDGA